MNRLLSVFLIFIFSADLLAVKYERKYRNDDYKSDYVSDYIDDEDLYDNTNSKKHSSYVTPKLGINILNWKNTMNIEGKTGDSETFNGKIAFGGGVSFGTQFDRYWRGEIELGHKGGYEETADGITFGVSIPYAIANFLYNLDNGLYFGFGTGIAYVNSKLSGDVFIRTKSNQAELAPMGSLMFGYSYRMNKTTYLDFNYNLSLIGGLKQQALIKQGVDIFDFTNRIGLISDFGLGIGLRYHF